MNDITGLRSRPTTAVIAGVILASVGGRSSRLRITVGIIKRTSVVVCLAVGRTNICVATPKQRHIGIRYFYLLSLGISTTCIRHINLIYR